MSILQRIVRRAIVPVAVASAIFLAPSAALAADSETYVTCTGTFTVKPGATAGTALCNSTVLTHTWGDGTKEVFVVGTNSAVWHTWQRSPGDTTWSSWASLGGVVHSGSNNGVWAGYQTSTQRPVIEVYGTDNEFWCKKYVGSGAWSAWYHCYS